MGGWPYIYIYLHTYSTCVHIIYIYTCIHVCVCAGMRPGHVAKLEPVACNGTQERLFSTARVAQDGNWWPEWRRQVLLVIFSILQIIYIYIYVCAYCVCILCPWHASIYNTHTHANTHIYIGMRPLVFDFICPCENLLHMRQLSHHAWLAGFWILWGLWLNLGGWCVDAIASCCIFLLF